MFTHRDPLLDSGSLWFVGVLLIFSVAVALGPPIKERTITTRHVVGMTMIVAGTTFLTRLVFPARSGQVGDLHLWWWPQCLGMFLLGAIGGKKLAERVPEEIYRMCRNVVVATVVVLPIAAALMGVLDLAKNADPFLGGWRWQAFTLAAIEGVLVVAGSLWLIGLAQRRLTGQGPLARGPGPVRLCRVRRAGADPALLATAMRPLDLPAEAKAPLVGATSDRVVVRDRLVVTSRRGASARSS